MMTRDLAAHDSMGVVCIFCSKHTPLPFFSLSRKPANGITDGLGRSSLIRCKYRDEEARYRPTQIIPLRAGAT